eukprot:17857-Pyramimonas_sp.AAC.1
MSILSLSMGHLVHISRLESSASSSYWKLAAMLVEMVRAKNFVAQRSPGMRPSLAPMSLADPRQPRSSNLTTALVRRSRTGRQSKVRVISEAAGKRLFHCTL